MELYIIWYTLIGIVIIWLFTLPLKIIAMNFRLFREAIKLKKIWWKKIF